MIDKDGPYSLPCGCSVHGDHLACTRVCQGSFGSCVHPLSTVVAVPTDAEADLYTALEPHEALFMLPPQSIWVDIRVQVTPDVGAEFGAVNSLEDFIFAADPADVAAQIERHMLDRDLDTGWHVTKCRSVDEMEDD